MLVKDSHIVEEEPSIHNKKNIENVEINKISTLELNDYPDKEYVMDKVEASVASIEKRGVCDCD